METGTALGIAGLTVGVLGLFPIWKFVETIFNRLPYQTIDKKRRITLSGTWKGHVHRSKPRKGVPVDLPVEITLKAGRKVVQGTSIFTSPGTQRGEIKNIINGGFHYGTLLRLDYHKEDRSIVGFGTILMQLSADARTLEGMVIGFSSHFEELFAVKITLNKVGL